MGSRLEEQTVFVGHCNCEEDAVKVAQNIRERYGVPEIVVHFIGPVIGTHAGRAAWECFLRPAALISEIGKNQKKRFQRDSLRALFHLPEAFFRVRM